MSSNNLLHSLFKIEILSMFTFFIPLLNLFKIINDKCKSTIASSSFFLFNCLNPMINASYFFFCETQKVAFNWKTFHRLQFVRCSLSPPEHDCSLIYSVKQPLRSSRLVSFSFALIYRHLEYFPPLFFPFFFILPFVRLSNIFPRNCVNRINASTAV